MKRFNFKIIALIAFVLFSMVSCSSDDSEGDSDGITTGNYFPLAVNNQWRYDKNGVEALDYISNVNDFQGVPYYRFEDSDNDGLDITSWIAKKGASYYLKSGKTFMALQNGATLEIDEYDVKIFRDDLDVGKTWKGAPSLKVRLHNGGTPQNIPAKLKYTGTILERNATVTLGTNTFTNVIKSKLQIVETVNSQVTYIDSEYWFAEGIGLIRESLISSTDNVTKTKYLVSYTLQ